MSGPHRNYKDRRMQVATSVGSCGSVQATDVSLFRQLVAYIFSLGLYILCHLLHMNDGCNMSHITIHKN